MIILRNPEPDETFVISKGTKELVTISGVRRGSGELGLAINLAPDVRMSRSPLIPVEEEPPVDQFADFWPILSPPIVPREVVTAKTVLDVFQRAFLPAEFDYEGDVLVSLHGGMTVNVLLVTGGPYLKLVMTFALRADADELLKLRMVNRLNRMTNGVFTIPQLETLIAVRFFQYPNGLVPYQLVEAVQDFAQDIRNSLARNDDDALVCDLPPEWLV